ncbi:MAG: RsmB/NOP family class I SAM-dependent RNA methyltransferase [Candidatus Thermoplasmatota archaeon]|nr:RsmB/NOP family class I SAM-dependent RNA methyltransferase [Candidatus Thermoplasmatota archaeon]
MTGSFKQLIPRVQPDLFSALYAVFWQHTYATKAIEKTLHQHPEWEDELRMVFSETVYDLIRWWRPLWYILNQEPSSEEKDLQHLLMIYLFSKKGDLGALQKNKGPALDVVMQRIATAKKKRALRESIPDWLDSQGVAELGSRWDTVIASLNSPPRQTIRVNTMKTTSQQLLNLLKKQGITAEVLPGFPDALWIKEKTNVFTLRSFHQGFFEVQDAASQAVSLLLDPKPGMRVVDACAGEGSKTLHLAALLKNKGKIIALDTQDWRLKEVRKRASKAGAETVETRVITATKTYKRMYDTADRLLLDVPCSGLGTLQRNPDIRWRLQPDDLHRLKNLQSELLQKYSPLLRPDGQLVYSVCSIFPSEGEEQISQFLTKNPTFHLLKEQRYWPDTDKTDGFYLALLKRTASTNTRSPIPETGEVNT